MDIWIKQEIETEFTIYMDIDKERNGYDKTRNI